MAIGDALYFDAAFTHPIKNHPKAPFTDAIGNVLRQAYLHAQHSPRLVLTQSYGFDVASHETDTATKRSFARNTDVGIAWGYADLPREITHLRAVCMFAVHSHARAEVFHTLFVSGSPDTNTETFLTDSVVDPTRASQTDQSRLRVEFPFSDRYKTYKTQVLTPVTSALPNIREIRVSAHAVNDDSDQAEFYQPLYVAVFWEYLPT